jgi:hypothetical protein
LFDISENSDRQARSESDFEIVVFRVGRDFLDAGISQVTGHVFLNFAYAIIYVLSRSLGKHLDGAVSGVADITGQMVAAGHSVGREAKTNALNSAGENYMLCNHLQLIIDY